jgi:hypothetical protein
MLRVLEMAHDFAVDKDWKCIAYLIGHEKKLSVEAFKACFVSPTALDVAPLLQSFARILKDLDAWGKLQQDISDGGASPPSTPGTPSPP